MPIADVPQVFGVQQVSDSAGRQKVLLEFWSPCGSWVVLMDPANARDLAAKVERAAGGAASGLLLPPGGGL